jgi:hypothetical protein
MSKGRQWGRSLSGRRSGPGRPPEPNDDLITELVRALDRLESARAAYDGACYRFQVYAFGDHIVMTVTDDGIEAAKEIDRALEESLILVGRYRTYTKQMMRASGERSGKAMTKRWAVIISAYDAIERICPESSAYIRSAMPEMGEILTWAEKLPAETSTLLNGQTREV